MGPDAVRKVVFVDLDGTLVLDNSFHLFLWSLWTEGGPRLRLALFRAASARMMSRRNGRSRMKQAMLQAFAGASADRQRAIIARTLAMMQRTVSRPVLTRVLAYRNEGWLSVLATAAPDCYARPFAEALGFDACLASPGVQDPENWNELIGARKAAACRAWAADLAGSTISEIAVISDHSDDLPLLRMASRVVIQAAPSDAAALVGGLPAGTVAEQIDPVSAHETGGMWLWINDRPWGPCDIWEVKTVLSKHRYALLYRTDGSWDRILPGCSLSDAALRVDCPRPPSARDRLSVAARRLIVRDYLGVYH